MNHLHIDIETYAEADLTKTGVYKYAADKTFEILLFAYSLNYQPVQIIDLTQGEKIPANIIRLLTDENTVKHAYNAQFERICLTHYLQQLNLLNSAYLPPEQWKCTMVWAASTSLPLSLQNVGTILGVEKQKLETGKTLIRKFTKPYLGKRYQPTEHLEEWTEFKKYCIRDVETEIEIEEKLSHYPMPETEWEYYWDDQHINDTGIHIDAKLVENALKIDETHRTILTKEATTITGLANPNSPIALKQWLNQHGCPIQTLTKQEVADTIAQTKNPQVKQILEIRQELAKTSTRKYQAMLNTILDGRGHGFLQFNGAGRTGRFAGRLVQVQNLPRNYLPDLDTARNIVANGNHELLNLLYPSVPDTLSQLTRTAFTPKQEHLFTVADYSAIEARVLAWLANETTTLNAFKNGQDLYCATASAMFGVPVEKHGANSELRQKGKIATLACIAEGQKVLTDHGLIPIEHVTRHMRVWDGSQWVHHDGVIYKGVKNVITYQGLTATPDHLVWVQGQTNPIPFGKAAASGARLIQTGNSWHPIRVGKNNQSAKTLEPKLEPLLRRNKMRKLWQPTMDTYRQPTTRSIKRLSTMLRKRQATHTQMARPQTHSGKTTLRKLTRPAISQLRRTRNKILLPLSHGSWNMDIRKRTQCEPKLRVRPNQQQWALRERKSAFCQPENQLQQPQNNHTHQMGTKILALHAKRRHKKTFTRIKQEPNNYRCPQSRRTETEKLAANTGKTRVYDIQNAGKHHRYTVSGRLVHNCGYGGSIGALKAMGALNMGLKETELQPIVTAWRKANPNTVKLWQKIDELTKNAIKHHQTGNWRGLIKVKANHETLAIRLPSGRHLYYRQPQITTGKYGQQAITYRGSNNGKTWTTIETYGAKIIENITQAIARDLLTHAIHTILPKHRIVMHVHDEIVCETPAKNAQNTLNNIVKTMCTPPPWATGLPLSADGYICSYYQKD